MTGPTPTLDLSVLLPVYRNAETLRPLHRALRRVLDPLDLRYELLFVCDACPDGSLALLEALAAEDRRVGVLSLARNVGQHRAVMLGLRYARGQTIITMDADLQDPPDAIPDLLRELRRGFAAVFAGRRGRYQSRRRLATSRVFKRLLHWLTGVPADAGMFLAMRRTLAARLLEMPARRPFVVALIGAAGLPTSSIPVVRSTRPAGESAYRARDRLRVAARALLWALRWRLGHARRSPRSPGSPHSRHASDPTPHTRIGRRFAGDERP